MRAVAIWAVLASAPVAAWGQMQAISDFTPLSASKAGIHLYGVTVYSGVYSSGSPATYEMTTQTPFLNSASASVSVAASVGGSHSGEKSSFSWNYSLSYFNMVYSEYGSSQSGSLGHRFGMSWTRKLSDKWSLSSSANGFLANFQQLYFNPSTLSSVAAMPTTFDDLASAMLAGKFTDNQLAALLTGAPVQASPQQAYLYGDRVLSAAASLGLTWAPSSRTSIAVSLSGSRFQNIGGVPQSGSTVATGVVLPQTTSASGSLSWSYSLSPRTQIGVQLSSSRLFSQLDQGYASNGSLTFGRTLSRRWFTSLHAGAGKLFYTQQIFEAPGSVQRLYGGSLGFKTRAQTFLASYDRSLGDAYALGSGSTSAAIGAWHWMVPGSGVSISASAGYVKLNNPTFPNTASWQFSAGMAKALGHQMSMTAQYMYFELPADLRVTGIYGSTNGVSMSLAWSPSGYR